MTHLNKTKLENMLKEINHTFYEDLTIPDLESLVKLALWVNVNKDIIINGLKQVSHFSNRLPPHFMTNEFPINVADNALKELENILKNEK